MKLLVFNCNLHNSAAISKPKSLLLENVRQKMRVTHFNKNGERNIVHYILSHWLLQYSDSSVRGLPPHSDRQDGNLWHTLILNSVSEGWEDPVPSSNLDLSHSSSEQEGSDILPFIFFIIVQIGTHKILIVHAHFPPSPSSEWNGGHNCYQIFPCPLWASELLQLLFSWHLPFWTANGTLDSAMKRTVNWSLFNIVDSILHSAIT